MARTRTAMLRFALCGQAESLLGRFVGLHFRHIYILGLGSRIRMTGPKFILQLQVYRPATQLSQIENP